MKATNLFTYEIFEVEEVPYYWVKEGEPRINSAYGVGVSTSPKKAKEQALKMFRTLWKWNVDNKRGCDVGCCVLGYQTLKKGGKILTGVEIPLRDKQEQVQFYHMILNEAA